MIEKPNTEINLPEILKNKDTEKANTSVSADNSKPAQHYYIGTNAMHSNAIILQMLMAVI